MGRMTSIVVLEHPDGVDITSITEGSVSDALAQHCEVRRLGHRSWQVTIYGQRPSDGAILHEQTHHFDDCNDADLWASAWAGREAGWAVSDLVSRANVMGRIREREA